MPTVMIEHGSPSTLVMSTRAAGNSPNGNVYFNTATGIMELIGVDELAMTDGMTPNFMSDFDGVTLRALYNFENRCRQENEELRKYKRFIKGSFRFAGAYNFVNGRKLREKDRVKIRSSGYTEFADIGTGDTNIDRVYHGITSLVDIQPNTQPYYAFFDNVYGISPAELESTDEATFQTATWIPASRLGDINQTVQVFGTTANGDTLAGDFDNRSKILVIRVRSWGYNPQETNSAMTGIGELDGFSAGYGIGETLNPTNTFALADVYGGARISPWTGMTLTVNAVSVSRTGFVSGAAKFKTVLSNNAGGTIDQCAAFLDAMAIANANISPGGVAYNGRAGRVWYSRDAAGRVVTSRGLVIDGLSAADKQKVVQTDDAGVGQTYPFFPNVEINVGAAAAADTNAWYRIMYETDGNGVKIFGTPSAVTVKDALGTDMNGPVDGASKITFDFNYDANTQASYPAGTLRNCVVLVEGSGGCAQAITEFKITRDTQIKVDCTPVLETNA